MASESTYSTPKKKRFTIPEHLKRRAVEVDYSTGWEMAPAIGAGLGLGASALTKGAIPPHLAAKFGLDAGGMLLGNAQADQEAKIAAENAARQEELSEYLILASLDMEQDARQAAIDFSNRELANINTKKNSPGHSYRPANWMMG